MGHHSVFRTLRRNRHSGVDLLKIQTTTQNSPWYIKPSSNKQDSQAQNPNPYKHANPRENTTLRSNSQTDQNHKVTQVTHVTHRGIFMEGPGSAVHCTRLSFWPTAIPRC
ncbi:hypothetical protein P167DRAFT_535654 [Morchella conica CCBAS932]|uniref:Uncharacterized protein n=1 Tax=Morchella conica CCBAS932 TaxID=1392247 RepID=A0A3N4KQ59_9PEZI|nr:hypothetical protein P167DRAFT_535654 [Morchella conica CCBAS932]